MPWWILLLVVLGVAGAALVVAYRAAMAQARALEEAWTAYLAARAEMLAEFRAALKKIGHD